MAQGQARKVKKKKKSVLKRAAQSRERAEVNRTNRTRVRGWIKRRRTAITAGDATAAGNLLHPTMSAIDQAISKGVLHENTANRYKSRLTLAFNQIKTKAAKPYQRFQSSSMAGRLLSCPPFLFFGCQVGSTTVLSGLVEFPRG